MNTSAVQGLEQQLQDAKDQLERRNLALELSKNRAFRVLIIEGFMRDDCARFTHESTDPALPADARALALQSAQAAGALKRFLQSQFQLGAAIEGQLPELEEALAEARAEEQLAELNLPAETHGDLS